MNHDEPLRTNRPHCVEEREGRFMGITLSRSPWLVGAFILGVLLAVFLIERVGLKSAALALFGPPAVLVVLESLVLRNLPPGYAFNWLETKILGGNLSELE